MMKKTLCLLFVLALAAQICAIPAGITDAEKEAKGAVDHVAAAAKDAKNIATKEAEKAIHPEHDKRNTSDHAGGTKHGGEEHGKRNASDHAGGAKHGGEGCQKRGAGLERPFTKIIKGSEEYGKKMADKGVKVLEDLFGLFNV